MKVNFQTEFDELYMFAINCNIKLRLQRANGGSDRRNALVRKWERERAWLRNGRNLRRIKWKLGHFTIAWKMYDELRADWMNSGAWATTRCSRSLSLLLLHTARSDFSGNRVRWITRRNNNSDTYSAFTWFRWNRSILTLIISWAFCLKI